MFFLMNNFVLQLDEAERPPAHVAKRFAVLTLDAVSKLGAEMFSEHPVLPISQPERARRLAMLIQQKAPGVNAALFVSPSIGAKPEQISVRYADVAFEVMAVLFDRQKAGVLTTLEADRLVWRRLAA
ncbi:MAG: hypothetical protein BGN86_06680 [Caulobacterales bacterium 68-7]|nr:hypothetical protein [Caulobacterales bacterium]OJU12094.1 MAG: hypothetical protein BGN86_06680 [Caulobacterales bacterium 68-7]